MTPEHDRIFPPQAVFRPLLERVSATAGAFCAADGLILRGDDAAIVHHVPEHDFAAGLTIGAEAWFVGRALLAIVTAEGTVSTELLLNERNDPGVAFCLGTDGTGQVMVAGAGGIAWMVIDGRVELARVSGFHDLVAVRWDEASGHWQVFTRDGHRFSGTPLGGWKIDYNIPPPPADPLPAWPAHFPRRAYHFRAKYGEPSRLLADLPPGDVSSLADRLRAAEAEAKELREGLHDIVHRAAEVLR